jgi:putative aldouronate transport system permease protein
MNEKNLGERIFDIFNIGLMVVLMIVMVYPLWYVVVASVSDPLTIVQNKGALWWPKGFTLAAYALVFTNHDILVGYYNTLFYVVVGTIINIILTAFGAYALSRRNLVGKNLIMFMIVFTMFFNGGLIPNYLLVDWLGLINTRWAIILPAAISTFNLIIMRTGFQAIPESIEESAKIDGANDFTILFRIFFPLALPVVAVMVLFYSVSHWNAYFKAMIYLRDRSLFPLQLFLREILVDDSTDAMMSAGGIFGDRGPIGETLKYATIIVATVPILCIYPFLQRFFLKGVMIGAIKE